MNTIYSVAIFLTFATVVHSLTCLPIELRNCSEKCVVEAKCPLGVAKDICNQCWICAKGFNESCGGIWNMGGTCAEGLLCTNPEQNDSTNFDPTIQDTGICCNTKAPPPPPNPYYQRTRCQIVTNKCSLQQECAKKQGETCGGAGGIYGECLQEFVCYPIPNYKTMQNNSTCVAIDQIPTTIENNSTTPW